ncbi:GNAT family N-acetyltransferase [Microbulbifer sp. SSSA002]|uniref:GNAT family N-acetyltransferase n=1 Tax=unclassified Microbulbifer TaxID=2619833 RepID=UPI0040397C27
MNISFMRSRDLKRAANFTFENMHPYYQRFAPDWDVSKVLEVTENLENQDILYNGEVVGVMRLQFEEDCCFLRDLQVLSIFQSKGIGKAALIEAKRQTLEANLNLLKLRVLKISPAVALYKRNGFVVQGEDERFFNMEAKIS